MLRRKNKPKKVQLAVRLTPAQIAYQAALAVAHQNGDHESPEGEIDPSEYWREQGCTKCIMSHHWGVIGTQGHKE